MDLIIDIILFIFALIFFILQVILFFKLWRMTNNVIQIKERFFELFPTEEEKRLVAIRDVLDAATTKNNTRTQIEDISVGMVVIYPPMKRIMIVKEIHEDGTIDCISYNKKNGKEEFEGTYKPSQIFPYNNSD